MLNARAFIVYPVDFEQKSASLYANLAETNEVTSFCIVGRLKFFKTDGVCESFLSKSITPITQRFLFDKTSVRDIGIHDRV